jgi:hypothetical protein
VEIFNGKNLVMTLYPFASDFKNKRIRILWEGAERRGRGRETKWDGQATVIDNAFQRIQTINFWNPVHACSLTSDHHVSWTSMTTGGFSGFDAWLLHPTKGTLQLQTPLLNRTIDITDINLHGVTLEAGGVTRQVRLYRLPEKMSTRTINSEVDVILHSNGDNPLYARVTQEDGHVGWTSPIYVQTTTN